MVTTYKVIGQPVPRVDEQKTTGAARYAIDVQFPGMLWGKALRSPHPHARIVRIDTSRALAHPGVRAVLTGADVQGHLQGRTVRDTPLLAKDVVRFVGDKVAVVAADDEATAEEALGLIDVEYDELPPLLDPLEAMKPGAPLIHPEMKSYQGYMRPAAEPSNVFFTNTYGISDPAVGFADADEIFEDTYTTSRIHPAFLEPRSCVVFANHDGRVEVWASTKAPHGLKASIAAAIGVPAEQVLIPPTLVGGDFGSKAPPMDEPLAYFLSLKTGKPVKMVMDYGEELLAGNPRHESIVRVKTGVKRDGTITAHEQVFIFNSGAYGGWMPLGFLAGVDRIAANWRIPHARFTMHQVYTNNLPGGYVRGPGETQGTFAMESHFDEIARKLGIDALEFRLKNILHEGDKTPMNEEFRGVKAEETLRAAAEAIDYGKPRQPNVGIGIALCSRPGGAGETHAAVTLRDDGTVLVQTPIYEQGTGTYTMLTQIVAEALGVSWDRMTYEVWDTDAVPNDSGVAGSRTTRMLVPAAYDAAQEAKAALIRLTSELTGWPSEQLTVDDGVVRRQDTGESTPWPDLLRRVPDQVVIGKAYSKEVGQPDVTAFAAQIAEVAVDPETGEVTVLDFVTAHDVGTVLNPIGHQGQINGGFMMGFGYSLIEELKVEDGHPTTLSFAEFKIPNIADIPPLRTVLIESGEGTGPYKAKAIGEVPILGVAPAIANAIRDAVGARIRSLPITAEKVYRALREREG